MLYLFVICLESYDYDCGFLSLFIYYLGKPQQLSFRVNDRQMYVSE